MTRAFAGVDLPEVFEAVTKDLVVFQSPLKRGVIKRKMLKLIERESEEAAG